MVGMIASITRIIRSGNATLADMAERIGLTHEQLADRLALMERQGYLARQPDALVGPDCDCGHCCASCCKRDGAAAQVLYMLTEEGEHLAQETVVSGS